MKLLVGCLTLLLSLGVNSQEETRLALVIGNANYDKGELKNPVNDALLIAETLEGLDFDVILDTNIANRRSFKETIREFGNRRPDYDVAFVYYAGHGIQVGSENYLLPTKEVFASEYDVQDYAVSVQNIMRHLTGMSNQVNILVLDACRDNPFEGKWNATRSLKGGGLAKMKAPSGSLIAFSTTAGTTAPDGEGMNSDYSRILAEQMKVPGISLDQVFRNVRREIFDISNGNQQTEESTQLTGETFYLAISDLEDELAEINLLIANKEYSLALDKASALLERNPNNIELLFKKVKIHIELKEFESSLSLLDKCIELDSLNAHCYCFRGYLHQKINESDKALDDYDTAILKSPSVPDYYHERGRFYLSSLNDSIKAKADFNKAIILSTESPDSIKYYYHRNSFYEKHDTYFFRSNVFEEFGEFDEALDFYDKLIDLYPNNPDYYYERSGLLFTIGKVQESINDLNIACGKSDHPNDILYFRSLLYSSTSDFEKAKLDAEKVISLKTEDPAGYFLLYNAYHEKQDFIKAIYYLSEAINRQMVSNDFYIPLLNDQKTTLPELYKKRAELFFSINEVNLMCKDYQKSCELGDCLGYEQYCE